ncbi:MAG: ABC transporter ATP-binding protein/permease [Treponema sp.]|jgi:ATP-binding cassette subfamily B protein|nr:ABC transporter ATP-binding protein/permease [Treponema sp.]
MPKLQGMIGISGKAYGDLKKAVAACTITNFSLILPVVVTMQLVMEILKPLTGGTLSIHKLWLFLGLGLAAGVIVFLCGKNDYKKTYVTSYITAEESRLQVAETIRKLPMWVFNSKGLTELTGNIMKDCESLEHVLSHIVPQLGANVISCTVICLLLSFFDWRIALAVFCTLPASFFIIVISRRRQERLNREQLEAKLQAAEQTQEYLEGIKIIKSCNLDGERFEALNRALRELKRLSLNMELGMGVLVSGAQFILQAGVGITIFTGTALLSGGRIELMPLILSLLIVVRMYGPILTVLTLLPELFYLRQATGRMRQLADIPVMGGSTETPVTSYTIEFDHVGFRYNDEEVLRDITVTIPEKSITALVGPSGSGKSTMTRLIARFWDVRSGSIRIGGVDIKTLEPEHLMGFMAFVFQDVILFNDTVYNNIRIGNLNATEGEIMAAAKAAHCDEFVSELPDKYHTLLGENGLTLSGGERQRISIARALLKDAPVILLDEATASLDPENETMIQEALSRLIENKTVLVIAHRLRTIAGADKIIVLDKGRITGEGTHEELLAGNKLYKKMYALQQGILQAGDAK